MYFRKIKNQLTEFYINESIESDAEGNALTIADIFSSGTNAEEDVELKIDSEKLCRFIEEELDDSLSIHTYNTVFEVIAIIHQYIFNKFY